jgi:hypothetical protein
MVIFSAGLTSKKVKAMRLVQDEEQAQGPSLLAESGSESGSGSDTETGAKLQHLKIELVAKNPLQEIFSYVEMHANLQRFPKKYYAAKHAGISLIVLMSLYLYLDLPLLLSDCDIYLDGVGGKPCNKSEAIQALIGCMGANALVGYNVGLLSMVDFEDRYLKDLPAELKKHFWFFMNNKVELARYVVIALISVLAAFPMAAPLFAGITLLRGGARMLSGFEIAMTLISNAAFNIFSMRLIWDLIFGDRWYNYSILAAFSLSLPSVSLPAAAIYGTYQLHHYFRLSPQERILNSLKREQNKRIEIVREEVLSDLDRFIQLASKDIFTFNARKLKYELIIPKALPKKLSPKKIKTYLAQNQNQGQSASARAYDWVKMGFQGVLANTINVGMGGFYFSTLVTMAGWFAASATPTTVWSSLEVWQWLVTSQMAVIPEGIFLVMTAYFSLDGVGNVVDILSGHFESVQGFKIYPKTALLLTAIGGYVCWESQKTATYLMDGMIKVITDLHGESVLTSALSAMVYTTPLNNFASWITIVNALMLELAKGRCSADQDAKTFVAIVEKIRMDKNLISKMDPEALAESLNLQWKSDAILAEEAKRISPITETTALIANKSPNRFAGLRDALFSCCSSKKKDSYDRLQEEDFTVNSTI